MGINLSSNSTNFSPILKGNFSNSSTFFFFEYSYIFETQSITKAIFTLSITLITLFITLIVLSIKSNNIIAYDNKYKYPNIFFKLSVILLKSIITTYGKTLNKT